MLNNDIKYWLIYNVKQAFVKILNWSVGTRRSAGEMDKSTFDRMPFVDRVCELISKSAK